MVSESLRAMRHSEAEISSWPERDRPVLSLCCGRGACSPQSIGPPGAPLPRIFTAGLSGREGAWSRPLSLARIERPPQTEERARRSVWNGDSGSVGPVRPRVAPLRAPSRGLAYICVHTSVIPPHLRSPCLLSRPSPLDRQAPYTAPIVRAYSPDLRAATPFRTARSKTPALGATPAPCHSGTPFRSSPAS